MKTIPLYKRNDVVSIVDDEDYDKAIVYQWYLHKTKYNSYASGGKGRLFLHHFVLGTSERIDHINGDGLDNRKANLRVATHEQNNWNRRVKAGASGYRGVLYGRAGQIVARVKHKGKNYYLGAFPTLEEAARARDKKAYELGGEFAILNFPRTKE